MNKFTYLLGIAAFSLIMFSCSGGSSPKAVAQDFMEALAKQDFKTAKELGTNRTKGFISMLEGMMQMMPEKEKKENKSFNDLKDIKWGETKIDNDKAVVYYGNGEGQQEKVNLKKVDGKWKVDMKKDM